MKIQDKVAQNDNRFRKLAPETFSDTAWVLDAKTFTFNYISPQIKELRGYSPDEIIGNSPESILTPESYEKIVEILNKAILDYDSQPEKQYCLEIEIRNSQGIPVWLEVTAKLITDTDDTLKVVGVSKTITERKVKETERNRLISQLNEALAEKERLVEDIKRFESLLPICSACRRIKDDEDTWWPIEKYIEEKAGSRISHTICPDCTKVYYK